MEYNDDIFCKQFPVVKTFLYHLTCYRELNRIYQELDLKSEFWTHTIDAHLLQAAILWCMVFGSHGNSTHWKKLCNKDREKLEDSFRDGLFKNTELTKEKWDAYGKDMRNFRNKYAAHREVNYAKPVPQFKIAEEAAYFYDEWIRKLIAPDILKEPPLKESVALMQTKIRPMAMHYLSETKFVKVDTGELPGDPLPH